jgi:hypothetical protein
MRALVLVALLASGCGGDSPNQPTSAVTFTGLYNGLWTVSNCADSASGFCRSAGFTPGAQYPLSLSIGQTQSAVNGTVTFGALNGTFQGVASGTSLAGTAALTTVSSASGASAFGNVTRWASTLSGSSMAGTFTIGFRFSTPTPDATINGTIVSLTR